MGNCNTKLRLFLMLLITAGFLAVMPSQVRAADRPVSISYCKTTGTNGTLIVKAKVYDTSGLGGKLYLLNLNAYTKSGSAIQMRPLASVRTKGGKIKYSVAYDDSMLYNKFVIARRTGGGYIVVSNEAYIMNPEKLATYTGDGPSSISKKGLQVEDDDDAIELGVQKAVLNWTMSSILESKSSSKTVSFQYKGVTYYFDNDLLNNYDARIKRYNDAGAQVSVILLLPNDSKSSTSAMRYPGASKTQYSSVKSSSKAGARTFEALMTYLGSRYGNADHLVSGWILGNEVNSTLVWNYAGGSSLNKYLDNYVRNFHIMTNAVRSVNAKARTYISLDYNWNVDPDGGSNNYFSSREVLDTFYDKIKNTGNIAFQIAWHAYPQGLSDPIFWDDTLATNSTSTKIINFDNIRVLTNYVKKKMGTDHTIMLSEQSFNSTRGEEVQAAAYAYAYYLSESNSMIEAFIYGREFDHPVEGYNWGLCDIWRGKRLIWNVFQYIDSSDSFMFTNPLKPFIGTLSSWKSISGYPMARNNLNAMPSKLVASNLTSVTADQTSASKVAVTLTWDKVLSADGYEIYRSDNGGAFSLVTTVSSNSTLSWQDTSVTVGNTYAYYIRMYKGYPVYNGTPTTDRDKAFGANSNTLTITCTTAASADATGQEADTDSTEASTEQTTTETPSTQTPSTETPSTETPSTQTPSTETPSTQTPSTETPSTETPSTETPSTETPSTETPSTQTPSTETPSTETPSTQTPSTETPSTETPSTETPSTETPSTQTSSTEMSSTQTTEQTTE